MALMFQQNSVSPFRYYIVRSFHCSSQRVQLVAYEFFYPAELIQRLIRCMIHSFLPERVNVPSQTSTYKMVIKG